MGQTRLSYLELEQRANQLSNMLTFSGVRPGDVVGICLKRSSDLVAGVLAILKAGAAYLPLDPEYPAERLKFMVSHSEIKVMITQSEYSSLFEEDNVQKIILDETDLSFLSNARHKVISPAINPAYVIYTSGSTGLPKGVVLGHGALSNLILWQNQQTRIIPDLKTLQFTPISFDVHFQEIFSTLTTGGELVLIDEGMRLNPVELLRTLSDNHIGRIFLPYVALNQLAETAVKLNLIPSALKEITTAGEQLKITPAIREFFSKLDNALLYNHYGPSETHVVSSLTLGGDSASWPNLPSIGKAIDNCALFILDEKLQPVVEGVEGELYLAGLCLAEGYINSPELTSERFIHHKSLGRLYKTGDVAILEKDGSTQFLGRKDGQIKIRGYRIEVGEIEVSLQKVPGLKQSAVKVIEVEQDKWLVAYFVGEVSSSVVREALRATLPDYMIPSHLIKLEALPLTPSGKVDYKALPLPSQNRPDLMVDFLEPEGDNEELLSKIWKKHLSLNQIGSLDNFFDLGGNSLLAIRMMIEMNLATNQDISVVEFFEAPTIKQLAQVYSSEQIDSVRIKLRKDKSCSQDIAVIGVTGRFPGAESVQEFWSNLLDGKSSLETFKPSEINPAVPKELSQDPDYVFVHGAFPGQKSFDYKYFGMTPREAELMDPQQRKFLELSVEALEQAGHYSDKTHEVIGVFAGMGNSKYSRLVDQHPEKVAQAGEFNVMLGLEKDYIATRVSHKLNLTGPSLSIHTGCSTSLVAIIEAVKSLRVGDCSLALAGGVSISGAPQTGHLFQEGGILSKDGFCRPYDENATGTVFTDGAGIVVLKRLDDAIESGDHIWGVIKGVGINNDGADKMSFTAPSSKGQADAIRRAHLDAGIDARTISFIEGHGTATPVGDPIEVQALTKAFSSSTKDKSFCYLSSIKANVGHLTAAAGVAGFIKALLVVNKGIVPPTANFKTPNKLLNLSQTPFIVSAETHRIPETQVPRRAGVSSFGVGGTNGHIVIEQYVKDQTQNTETVNEPFLFKLSAKSLEQVNELEKNLLLHLQGLDSAEWPKVAFTLATGRKEFAHRRTLVLESKEDIKFTPGLLKTYKHFKKAPLLHMMFPGQGSQYIKMGQGLLEHSALFKNAFEECSQILKGITGYDIQEILAGDKNPEALNNTFYTQPAIFIIEYSLGKMMMDMGYVPKGFIGHSIGEYVAATLAGIFSLEDGLRIIAKRAELMNDLAPGSMLSVGLGQKETEQLLKNYKLDIAAVNSPQSTVVSGEQKEIEKLKAELDLASIGSVMLKTSHAFHSRMMISAVEEFKKFLDTIPKALQKVSILSTVSLKRDDAELQTSEYWAQHLVRSVLFSPAINQLMLDDVFLLEVGPRSVLANLSSKQALEVGQKNIKICSLLSDKFTSEVSSFLKALGDLWSSGLKLKDTNILFKKEHQHRAEAPTYVFEKNTVWLETRMNK